MDQYQIHTKTEFHKPNVQLPCDSSFSKLARANFVLEGPMECFLNELDHSVLNFEN